MPGQVERPTTQFGIGGDIGQEPEKFLGTESTMMKRMGWSFLFAGSPEQRGAKGQIIELEDGRKLLGISVYNLGGVSQSCILLGKCSTNSSNVGLFLEYCSEMYQELWGETCLVCPFCGENAKSNFSSNWYLFATPALKDMRDTGNWDPKESLLSPMMVPRLTCVPCLDEAVSGNDPGTVAQYNLQAEDTILEENVNIHPIGLPVSLFVANLKSSYPYINNIAPMFHIRGYEVAKDKILAAHILIYLLNSTLVCLEGAAKKEWFERLREYGTCMVPRTVKRTIEDGSVVKETQLQMKRCANDNCNNLVERVELRGGGYAFTKCSKCWGVAYCSQACLNAHHATHRPECKIIQAQNERKKQEKERKKKERKERNTSTE